MTTDTELRATACRRVQMDNDHPRYKWVVLSNTTLGILLASINASIVLISLPAIFRVLFISRAVCWSSSSAACLNSVRAI